MDAWVTNGGVDMLADDAAQVRKIHRACHRLLEIVGESVVRLEGMHDGLYGGLSGRLRFVAPCSQYGRWQATRCPGASSVNWGVSVRQRSTARGQRVWNAQPGGGLAGLGG